MSILSRLMTTLGALMVFAAPVAAEPYLAAYKGMQCSACHVHPAGGGMRNEYGNVFSQSELPAKRIGDDNAALWTGKVLDWAARLHEIGLDISHDGYQRHGAYIAEHADMPGFPRAEQQFLALLIGGQRHRINELSFEVLPESWQEAGLRLLLLLRLAVLLNRSRKESEHPPVRMQVSGKTISIGFDGDWLPENPLTIADLEREQGLLRQVGYDLRVS